MLVELRMKTNKNNVYGMILQPRVVFTVIKCYLYYDNMYTFIIVIQQKRCIQTMTVIKMGQHQGVCLDRQYMYIVGKYIHVIYLYEL